MSQSLTIWKLTLALLGLFTPWKSAKATYQSGLFVSLESQCSSPPPTITAEVSLGPW